jgi:hypothetical protein
MAAVGLSVSAAQCGATTGRKPGAARAPIARGPQQARRVGGAAWCVCQRAERHLQVEAGKPERSPTAHLAAEPTAGGVRPPGELAHATPARPQPPRFGDDYIIGII